MDFSQFTDDQLVEQSQQLGVQIDELREQRRAIADEMRVRLSAQSQAAAVLASLSPEALEELKKQIVIAQVQPMADVGVAPPQA